MLCVELNLNLEDKIMVKGPIIGFHHRGKWTETEKILERLLNIIGSGKLDKYGEMGVEALREATPKKTGLTAASWYYEIYEDESTGSLVISWNNDNVQQGQRIAVILQEGHATRGGGYFEGIDYINPALESVFGKIAEDAYKEVWGVL